MIHLAGGFGGSVGECHNHAGYRVHKEDETEFKSTLTGNIDLPNTDRAHSTRQKMIILSVALS